MTAGIPDPRETQLRRITAWSRVYMLGLVLVFGMLLGRVIQLKVAPDTRLDDVRLPRHSVHPELARRGDVYDRRGRLLATSVQGYRLFADPKIIGDVGSFCAEITERIGVDRTDLQDRIEARVQARPETRYVVLNDNLEAWQVDAFRAGRIRGAGLEPRLIRSYPHGDLGAALIGRVGSEHRGQGGVELRFDERLTQSDGRLVYLRDVQRSPIWIDADGYQPAVDGADVHLTLDIVVQEIAERRLRRAVEDCNAGGGRVVVLDCRTGDLLAMCDVIREREGWDPVAVDPGRDVHPSLGRNRCVSDPYEPGSTFKPLFWAAAIDLGVARPEEHLPTPADPAHRTSKGRRIRDTHYVEDASFEEVLVYSINSGMAIAAERMSHAQLRGVVASYGFGTRTRCGLPGESPGLVTTAKNWSHYSQTSVPMGHEIAVTPVQMVRAFSAIARDGTLPAVRLAAPAAADDFIVQQRAISADAAMRTREALRNVMTMGTGQRAQSDRYRLFGKSGTPQRPKPAGGGYYEDRYVPSFIAGAPFADPRIVVLCVIDDPDKLIGHYGGVVAGPAVRDIIDETLIYLGVASDIEDPGIEAKASPADA